jgi:serine/threonine protein kinase
VSALERLHGPPHYVLHGDLKPGNILITLKGCVKLADFGSAVLMQQHVVGSSSCVTESLDLSCSSSDSRSSGSCYVHSCQEIKPKKDAVSQFRGTNEYSSPEVLNGTLSQLLSPAADLWSLACVLYAMWNTTGNYDSPFSHCEKSDMMVLQKMRNYFKCDNSTTNRSHWLFPPDSELSVRVPEEWKSTIIDMLHPFPQERLGMTDHAIISDDRGSEMLSYLSLRARLLIPLAFCGNQSHLFLPETVQALQQQNEFHDGASSWSPFLI